MNETIIVALISGGLTLFGTVLTVMAGNKKIDDNLKVSQAITETKLEVLTEEVRKHNNFATRIPVIENDIKTLYQNHQECQKLPITGTFHNVCIGRTLRFSRINPVLIKQLADNGVICPSASFDAKQ